MRSRLRYEPGDNVKANGIVKNRANRIGAIASLIAPIVIVARGPDSARVPGRKVGPCAGFEDGVSVGADRRALHRQGGGHRGPDPSTLIVGSDGSVDDVRRRATALLPHWQVNIIRIFNNLTRARRFDLSSWQVSIATWRPTMQHIGF